MPTAKQLLDTGLETHAWAARGVKATLANLPRTATFLPILGVQYVHVKTDDGGDLYLTDHGLPFYEHLKPHNWYESEWFKKHRLPMQGTGTVYYVPTKPLDRMPKSIELLVKWSRVGEDVPLNTYTLNRALDMDFNSPFEEFSLVEELRTGNHGPRNLRIRLQKPLAIYVPPEHMQLWQSGRSRDKIRAKIARHAGVEIDILRSYILIYQWIKGYSAVDAYHRSYLEGQALRDELEALTKRVDQEMAQKGFIVADHKPTHVIVRMENGSVVQRHGKTAYAVVDYELLTRTEEYAEVVKRAGRSKYLHLQSTRFDPGPVEFPPNLRQTQVLDVPFVYGHAESTSGLLYVVGKDPNLFSYFLPERWRVRHIRISRSNQTYYTRTKDRIHLVWKVSRVGDLPPGDIGDPKYRPKLLHGYNSPFEEFSLAMEMHRAGVKAVYPRAIYATGIIEGATTQVIDARRFERMRETLAPDGTPALQQQRDYITIWGYYRGLEDVEAIQDTRLWTPIDLLRATLKKLLSPEQAEEIKARHARAMNDAGFVDLHAKPDHILLAYIPGGDLKLDANGNIEARQCNLELVKRL